MNRKSIPVASSLLFLVFFIWSLSRFIQPALPKEDGEIIFYSNQTRDDLRETLLAALRRAEHSVLVIVYGL